MNLKSWIKLLIIAALIGWYLYYLYHNPKGILFQRERAAENAQQASLIAALEADIEQLQTKKIKVQSDAFEQEKLMREDLQMSCTNEYVYLLPQQNQLKVT